MRSFALSQAATRAALSNADSVVVVSSSSLDGARSASATLDWLEAHGRATLAIEWANRVAWPLVALLLMLVARGSLARFVVEAIGAADQEAGLAPPTVAPLLELPCESEGAELPAFLVEEDGDAVLRGRRKPPAALRKLGHFNGPDDALQIALDQLSLGPSPDPPTRDDVEQQGLAGWSHGRRLRRPLLEGPHALQIVEAAHFGAEQVDDHVVGVD